MKNLWLTLFCLILFSCSSSTIKYNTREGYNSFYKYSVYEISKEIGDFQNIKKTMEIDKKFRVKDGLERVNQFPELVENFTRGGSTQNADNTLRLTYSFTHLARPLMISLYTKSVFKKGKPTIANIPQKISPKSSRGNVNHISGYFPEIY